MRKQADRDTLINMEKSFLSAYQRNDAAAFKANMGDDYIGVAAEGVLTAARFR